MVEVVAELAVVVKNSVTEVTENTGICCTIIKGPSYTKLVISRQPKQFKNENGLRLEK
jgi:hypothetical protein